VKFVKFYFSKLLGIFAIIGLSEKEESLGIFLHNSDADVSVIPEVD